MVLTRLPFLTFYQTFTELLVFKLYNLPVSELQSQLLKLLSQIQDWPAPEPLSKLSLPVLDY